MTAAERKLTTDTPYLTITGELWSVSCDDFFGENWPHFNDTVYLWLMQNSDTSHIACTHLTTHTPSATHTHRHTHKHTPPLCRSLCQRLTVLVRIPIPPYQWLSKEYIDNIKQLCQYKCQCTNPCCNYVILMNKSIWISNFDIWILIFQKDFRHHIW